MVGAWGMWAPFSQIINMTRTPWLLNFTFQRPVTSGWYSLFTGGEGIAVWRVFPTVDTCLSCEDIDGQICVMVPRLRFLAIFRVLYFSELRAPHFKPAF